MARTYHDLREALADWFIRRNPPNDDIAPSHQRRFAYKKADEILRIIGDRGLKVTRRPIPGHGATKGEREKLSAAQSWFDEQPPY